MDESGFPLNNAPPKIVAAKRTREGVKLTNVERSENVTVAVCCKWYLYSMQMVFIFHY